MGARQSKRSVDITTTPKKGEGEVAAVEGEGKMEKIGEIDAKVTTNGTIHSEIEYADEDESSKVETNEKPAAAVEIKENGVPELEETKAPEADAGAGDVDAQATEVTAPVIETTEKVEETPENKKNKEKSKKKKWSFRSISFSKKDKSKPNKDADKNGDVKEVAEENAEQVTPADAPKAEEPKAEEVVTNGDAVEAPKPAEEAPAKVAEVAAVAVKPVEEEPAKVVEEPKAPEPAESTPSPIKGDAKPPVEEPAPKAEETKPVVVESPVIQETKEVRTEEVPPPLPSSNPPSPVTVFAESTKADALPVDQLPITTDSPQPPAASPVQETPQPEVAEVPPTASPPVTETNEIINPPSPVPPVESAKPVEASPEPEQVVASESVSQTDVAQTESKEPEVVPSPSPVQETQETPSPVTESPVPETVLPDPEPVVEATDSLPDVSTESLPSLPEPVSESLPEPMSLPPVESFPEPIATDDGLPESTASEQAPVQSPVSDTPLPNETILTNGNTNGLPSPVTNDGSLPPIEGPLKQIPCDIAENNTCEITTTSDAVAVVAETGTTEE